MNDNSKNLAIDQAVLRIRDGDNDAFRLIISACEAHLRMITASILPQIGLVDDVVQKTLVVAFFRLDQYQIGTSFLGWITTIARYQALNERRHYYADRSLKDQIKTEQYLHKKVYDHEQAPEFASPVLHEKLQRCLGRLRDKASHVIRSYYLEQKSIEDIARENDQTSDWVYLTLHRARKALKSCITGNTIVDSHES